MKRFLIGAAIVAAATCVPFLLTPKGYIVRVLCITLLFAALAQAWNIVGGLARQVSSAMLHSSGPAPIHRHSC